MTKHIHKVMQVRKPVQNFLFEFFCAARIAYSWPEKAFNGFYFAVAESIILGVADELVIRCSDIIGSECTVALRNNFREFNFFKELGSPPASLFVSCEGNVVIMIRACECKIIGKLAGYHVPIFFLISQKIISNNFLTILRF